MKKIKDIQLKCNFENLIRDFKAITMCAYSYTPEEYLELLQELKDEIHAEIEVIESEYK